MRHDVALARSLVYRSWCLTALQLGSILVVTGVLCWLSGKPVSDLLSNLPTIVIVLALGFFGQSYMSAPGAMPWSTSSARGDRRIPTMIVDLCSTAGFPPPTILLFGGDDEALAVALPSVTRAGRVAISRAVLSESEPAQRYIAAHEMGHLWCRHPWITFAYIGCGLLFIHAFIGCSAIFGSLITAVLGMGLLPVWILGLLYTVRIGEYQADTIATVLVGRDAMREAYNLSSPVDSLSDEQADDLPVERTWWSRLYRTISRIMNPSAIQRAAKVERVLVARGL